MPLLDRSTYTAPRWLRHGHFQTIYPVLFRRLPRVGYQRQRVETPDGDFFDLDWSVVDGTRVGLIVHGLESSAREVGVQAMARALNRRRWDAVALNLRGCSGEPNRSRAAYHAGATGDLATAIHAVMEKNRYAQIGLIGFSLGGNLVLKYLGEHAAGTPPSVCAAAAVSVPCDLAACVERIMEPANWLYNLRIIRSLKKKLRHKQAGPQRLPTGRLLSRIKTVADFDELVTAPLHGFASATEYWAHSSCGPWLAGITTPTLLVNAQDDPLLTRSCFPLEQARLSAALTLETPRWGGHLGFVQFRQNGEYWHETRIASFLDSAADQPLTEEDPGP